MKRFRLSTSSSLPLAILVSSVILLVVGVLVLASVPPVSRDALTHHLYIPKLYLEHGSIYELPSILFSYFPMNLDLLYLVPLHFGNDIIPKYIHFFFALCTASLVFFYLKKRVSVTWAWFGAFCFLSTPIIIKLSITAYVDLGLIFFTTFSLLLVLKWAENTTRLRYLLGAALSCGLAVGTKYNGLISLVVLSLLIPVIFQRGQDDNSRSGWKAVGYGLFFVSISLLVYSPWGIRNIIWTGNPFYPLFGTIFGTEDTAVMGGMGPFVMRKLLYHESLFEILLIPIRIFFEGQDNIAKNFDGKLNPFLAIFPVFAFFLATQKRIIHREKIILLTFALLYLFIAFFQRDLRVRYIGPIIPPLVILSVYGLNNIVVVCREISCYKRVLLLSVYTAVFLSLLINFFYIYDQFKIIRPFEYLSGRISRAEYITRYRPEYPVVGYANSQLSEEAKILCVFLGNRGYYFDKKHVFDLSNGKSLLCSVIKENNDPENILQQLQADGFTHLIIRHDLWQHWASKKLTAKELDRYFLFQKQFMLHLKHNAEYILYALEANNIDSR